MPAKTFTLTNTSTVTSQLSRFVFNTPVGIRLTANLVNFGGNANFSGSNFTVTQPNLAPNQSKTFTVDYTDLSGIRGSKTGAVTVYYVGGQSCSALTNINVGQAAPTPAPTPSTVPTTTPTPSTVPTTTPTPSTVPTSGSGYTGPIILESALGPPEAIIMYENRFSPFAFWQIFVRLPSSAAPGGALLSWRISGDVTLADIDYVRTGPYPDTYITPVAMTGSLLVNTSTSFPLNGTIVNGWSAWIQIALKDDGITEGAERITVTFNPGRSNQASISATIVANSN